MHKYTNNEKCEACRNKAKDCECYLEYTNINECYECYLEYTNIKDPSSSIVRNRNIDIKTTVIATFWHIKCPSSFCCNKLNIYMFSQNFYLFSKNVIILQLQPLFIKVSFCFFFLISVFTLIYGFNQGFWLILLTLWFFFKTNPGFNACFKFVICITYSVLWYDEN